MDLYHEKLHQASELLAAHDLDLWLIFVRETAEHTDPSLKLLGQFSFTWPTAIMVTRNGQALALTVWVMMKRCGELVCLLKYVPIHRALDLNSSESFLLTIRNVSGLTSAAAM